MLSQAKGKPRQRIEAKRSEEWVKGLRGARARSRMGARTRIGGGWWQRQRRRRGEERCREEGATRKNLEASRVVWPRLLSSETFDAFPFESKTLGFAEDAFERRVWS